MDSLIEMSKMLQTFAARPPASSLALCRQHLDSAETHRRGYYDASSKLRMSKKAYIIHGYHLSRHAYHTGEAYKLAKSIGHPGLLRQVNEHLELIVPDLDDLSNDKKVLGAVKEREREGMQWSRGAAKQGGLRHNDVINGLPD